MGKQKGGRSKRDRKHKQTQSLKFKHGETALESMPDDALERLLEDSNAAILPPKADRESGGAVAASPPPERQVSRSQQRKLRRIQEEKDKRDKRADVLQMLAENQMKQEDLQLLRPMTSQGQRETKKQALKRALQLHRAGVDLPSEVRLFQERQRPDSDDELQGEAEVDGEDEAVASSSGSDSDLDRQHGGSTAAAAVAEGSAAAGPPAKKQRTAAPLPAPPPSAAEAEAAVLQQQADAKRRVQVMRQAAVQAKQEMGISDQRDEEHPRPQQPPPPLQQQAKGPGGKPRVVLVERRPEIQAVREGLPILGLEQEVMEAVAQHDVVVLCGETGCGKTTQVPQFLYEAGYGCKLFPERSGAIGVTQPRRVAAISTAERVADELDSRLGQVVGYQVRHDKRVGEGTAIKFMTDGILLREVQDDFLLRRYSVILVDEAHERSLNTDILCGMLSRVVALRRQLAGSGEVPGGGPHPGDKVHPLKLIIMSATLRTDDFVQNARLFPVPPPVVCVPARQFPVTVHFSKRTELHDYMGAAFKKARPLPFLSVSQIHRTLPPGGVLVFLTGQREVEHLCRKLRSAFNRKPRRQAGAPDGAGAGTGPPAAGGAIEAAAGGGEEEGEQAVKAAEEEAAAGVDAFSGDAAEVGQAVGEEAALLERLLEEDRLGGDEGAPVDDYDAESSGDEEDVVIMGGEGFTPQQIAEAEADFERRMGISLTDLKGSGSQLLQQQNGTSGGGGSGDGEPGPVHVLPLYAMLPPAQQAWVFRPPPSGQRLIVVATNVAETSLTIPGIRYVVDAGRSKQRLLETAAGLSRFDVRWVSKASAEQRAGRAGRTGPGHCYRLFSSAHFNDTFPQHTPPEILNTALEGVVLALKALGVHRVPNFPFPTPPEPAALAAAERCLVALSALDGSSGQLTALGRAMAAYPISPRHARMLLEVAQLEQQQQQQQQQQGVVAAAGGGGGGGSRRRRVLPYAVALAAVLSVASPFIHVDSVSAAAGEQADDEDEKEEGEEEGEEQDEAAGLERAAKRAERKAERAAAKRKQAAARQAHAQFRAADGDALSALRALCAFEAAGEDESFCRSNFLHFRNLKEASALHKQLARMLQAQQAQRQQQQQQQQPPAPGAAPEAARPGLALQGLDASSGGLPPPPPLVLEALRRALAAGWADQVSRRIRSLDYLKGQEREGRRSRAVRYRSCAGVEEDVFLHPNSALHSTAPEYVTYTELVRTVKRPYMAGLTGIEPGWLAEVAAPLCTFSAPLADPQPFYKPAADQVLCWRDATFGRHTWQLPRGTAPHPDPSERCAVFAAALLDGKVLPSFAQLKAGLAVPPSMLLRPELRVHKRAAELLAALSAAQVDSRAGLAAKWAAAPGFLRHELSQCMQKGGGGALLAAWDVLRAEAAAAAPAAQEVKQRKQKKKLKV
ncbi:ATP-dependent RNA helicase DEAH13 [Chlorella vulgaris]